MADNPELSFDSDFLRKLERLSLVTRSSMPGQTAGSRRSPRHGSSAEFAEFRNYAAGDDFRRIDWNAYARLDRLFLRLYRAEEVITLTLLLDRSPSMHFGRPSKALAAARLAAVFSFVALHNNDRVAVLGWSEKIDRALPAQSGKPLIPLVWQFIAELMAEPSRFGRDGPMVTDFAALRDVGAHQRQPGLAVVLSDFLTDTDWRSGLRALQTQRHEVTVVQVLAPEELDPSLRGDWRLRDSENASLVEITVTPHLLRRYREELKAHVAAVREFCRHEGMAFIQLSSDVSIPDTALSSLRAAGVVA
jgi:uncharacterized protein (DUF58 family)